MPFWGVVFVLWRQCKSKKSSFDLGGRPQSEKLAGTLCQFFSGSSIGALQCCQLGKKCLKYRERKAKKIGCGMDTLGEWLFGVLFLCSGGNVKVKNQVLTWEDGPSQKNWQGHYVKFFFGSSIKALQRCQLKICLK